MKSYTDGIRIAILIQILNDVSFYIALADNNKPFRVTVSGEPALTIVLVFRFFFLFSVHRFVHAQSVCVSVHLFTVTLKFLKTHKYWLAQLLHVSLVPGLEFEKCRLLIKMLRNFSKNRGEVLVTGFGREQPPQQPKFLLLLWLLFVLLYTSWQQWTL